MTSRNPVSRTARLIVESATFAWFVGVLFVWSWFSARRERQR